MKIKLHHKIAITLLRLIALTWRIKIRGDKPKSPSIIAFWHGKMLPVWRYFSGSKSCAVVSLSKDGQLLSALLEKWNYSLIRGSSSKGGSDVLNNICNRTDKKYILITPDGPQGPIYKFKAGAVVASHRSGLPLHLCGVIVKNSILLKKSWDNFCVPLPFSKIILNFSNSIVVHKDASRNNIDGMILDCQEKMVGLEKI